jgi:hypothetical protein
VSDDDIYEAIPHTVADAVDDFMDLEARIKLMETGLGILAVAVFLLAISSLIGGRRG